jgi:hypothetical protein
VSLPPIVATTHVGPTIPTGAVDALGLAGDAGDELGTAGLPHAARATSAKVTRPTNGREIDIDEGSRRL